MKSQFIHKFITAARRITSRNLSRNLIHDSVSDKFFQWIIHGEKGKCHLNLIIDKEYRYKSIVNITFSDNINDMTQGTVFSITLKYYKKD